jgi:hypothetical protein
MIAFAKPVAMAAILVIASACSGSTGSSTPPSPPAPTSTPTVAAAPSATPTSTPIVVLDGEPWIVYTWAAERGRGLYLVRPDGTDAHEIAIDVPGEPQIPDWSPDGRLIAFDLQVSDGVHEIWTSNADGPIRRRSSPARPRRASRSATRPGRRMASDWSSAARPTSAVSRATTGITATPSRSSTSRRGRPG